MNSYVHAVIHQLEVANLTIDQMISLLDPKDFNVRLAQNKRSLGELVNHLVLIYHADLLIADGASETEMNQFYAQRKINSIEEMRSTLHAGFEALKERYRGYSNEQLMELTSSYWGVSYSRFEWFLEIIAHIYHHRGQLHTLLVNLGTDLHISLFE
ncbi:DinB family protein [Rubeoparvulum massiliense]|uniref:DinB family protein n=1 Tax=Rubeoparvulum massiliense TaxID=1631346 RepID=UPI00065E0E1A|nr:DinB family protein [Rubeoparvulum massiliense]